MIRVQKKKGQEFVVLNLADVQLAANHWKDNTDTKKIALHTISTLVEREKPDLITVLGDISYGGELYAYESFLSFMDQFKIPWAPIFGNHDNQAGSEAVHKVVAIFSSSQYCLFEKGNENLGVGNYLIAIMEESRMVELLIMMDSHDRTTYRTSDGKEQECWAKLLPEQIAWYRKQVQNNRGVESTVMLHIPIYAYRDAFQSAFDGDHFQPEDVLANESGNPKYWKEGYKDSFGVKYEGVGSYPEDDGVFGVFLQENSTKHVLCGHEHVNNFSICFSGIRLTYVTKTGPGCYWNSEVNGGTVMLVGDNGVSKIYASYVNPAVP